MSCQFVFLRPLGLRLTVKLVTPNGEETYTSYVGGSFTFPTLENMPAYRFVGWSAQRIDSAADLSGITYYEGGSELTLSKSQYTFYTLYAELKNTPLDKAKFYLAQADDYTGAWAICGWDYLSNGFDAYRPYALDQNGQKLRVSSISDAVVNSQELEFETNDMSVRYRVLKADKGYTIQNMSTGRYLATNADFDILFLDSVTDFAKWNLEKSADNVYNTTVINVGNAKAAFVYDDEAQQFTIHDNSKIYTGSAYPAEWFYTLFYRCTNITQTVSRYTFGAHSHIYVGELTTPSTCTEDGIMTYTCDTCGLSYEEPFPATGHTESLTPAVEPTCTQTGLTEGRHCSVCGEILIPQQSIDAPGHSFETTVIAPDCTTPGYTLYTCTVCGDSHTQNETPALGHSETVDEGTAPDCTTPGLSDGKHCTVCGEVIQAQQPLPALGHSYEAVVVAPTCTEAGYTMNECTVCGESYVSDRVSATGHEYESVVTEPTCTEEGFTTNTCKNCGNSYISAKISALDHSYIPVVTEPTCTRTGFTTNVCTVCQASYISDNTPALGHSKLYTDNGDDHTVSCANCTYSATESHSFTDGKCPCGALQSTEPAIDKDLKFGMDISAGAEMVVNYNFMASVVEKYSDFYLEVKKDVAGSEPVVTVYTVDTLGHINHPTTGVPLIYNASYTGINAKEMGDNFATTLYATDENGKVYRSETVVSSIKDFLLSKIDENAIAEQNTMAVDMLRYGAAAQLRFGYGTENLVTDALSEKQLAYGTASIPEAIDRFSTSGNGANVSTSITVGSKVELSLSCIATGVSDPAQVKCIITDEDRNIIATPEVESKAGVMFSAKFDNVGAKQMRRVITAVFYDGSKVISKLVNWSVESYVAQTRANPNATPEEINMVNAMLTYGDSVAAYMTATGQ